MEATRGQLPAGLDARLLTAPPLLRPFVPFSLVTGGRVILLPGAEGRGSVPTTPTPTWTAVPGSLCRHQGALIQELWLSSSGHPRR